MCFGSISIAVGTLLKVVVDQGEAGFVLENCGAALAVKGGIEQCELPAGGGAAGDDGVLAAVEVEVLGLVADVFERGHAGADVEVHVGEEAVLRDVKANADGAGIAFAEIEVDVADGGVEGAGVGVDDSDGGRDGPGEWNGNDGRSVGGALHFRPRRRSPVLPPVKIIM